MLGVALVTLGQVAQHSSLPPSVGTAVNLVASVTGERSWVTSPWP